MIDDRINKSLMELEQQLKDLESARSQVKSTIDSFNKLSLSTKDYVEELNNISFKLQEIILSLDKDYQEKKAEYEKDRTSIFKVCETAVQGVTSTTNAIENKIYKFISLAEKKVQYLLVLNIIIVILLLVCLFKK